MLQHQLPVISVNSTDLNPERAAIDICVRARLDSAEIMQVESLYRESHIADPCSHCACFGGVQFSRDREWIADNASLPGTRFALAHRDNALTGFSQFYTEPDRFPAFVGDIASRFATRGKCAYMYLILVDASERSQGIGRKLYHAAFEESVRASCDTMLAEIFVCPVPNSTSLRFHESLGFQYSGLTATHSRKLGERQCELTYTQLFRPLAVAPLTG